jgi:hypothetical protein
LFYSAIRIRILFFPRLTGSENADEENWDDKNTQEYLDLHAACRIQKMRKKGIWKNRALGEKIYIFSCCYLLLSFYIVDDKIRAEKQQNTSSLSVFLKTYNFFPFVTKILASPKLPPKLF